MMKNLPGELSWKIGLVQQQAWVRTYTNLTQYNLHKSPTQIFLILKWNIYARLIFKWTKNALNIN